jgi:outer membrane protein W
MKKVFLKMVVASVTLVLSMGNSFGQGVSQGNVIIDAYYGFPNFGKSFLQEVEDANSGATNFKAGGIGPAGLRVEYMIADRIGLGVDVIYNSNSSSFTSIDSIYNGNTDTWTPESNSLEYKMQRVRAQLRFNYHFITTNPALDSYIGVGAGTNNRFRARLENGVDITDNDGLSNSTLVPFSLRIAAGLRYYFTDNIGLNTEIGLGGPLVSAGLSIKF